MHEAEMPRPRVLIVEDDAGLAAGVRDLLTTALDADVTLAMSVESARACVATDRFDMVVLDVMLPRTDVDLQTITELVDEFGDVRELIRERICAGDDESEALEALRTRRNTIQAEIQRLVREEAGLELLAEWREDDASPLWLVPVLVLAAVGDSKAVKEVIGCTGGAEVVLVVKPYPVERIVEMARRLIALSAHGQGGQQ